MSPAKGAPSDVGQFFALANIPEEEREVFSLVRA